MVHISENIYANRACHPSGHYWNYYPSALSASQNTATHLKMGHPLMKSMGAPSSNELQRLDLMTGYQDSSPSNGHQGDTPSSLQHLPPSPTLTPGLPPNQQPQSGMEENKAE